MKSIKFIIALAVAALGSAAPAANQAAIVITNPAVTNATDYDVTNITSHTTTNMTKAALSSLPSCTLYETWVHWEYDIWIGDVEDIAGKCRGLWDNLPHVECATHYHSYCGGIQSTGLLQWHFWTTDLCEVRAVKGAYYAATGTAYGDIECVRG